MEKNNNMKLSMGRLKEIIKEELFYREFYRNESAVMSEAAEEDPEQSKFVTFVHQNDLSKEDLRVLQNQITMMLEDPAIKER